MIDGNGGQWEEKDLEQKPNGQGRILLLLSGRAGYFSDSFNDMMKFPGQIGIGCAVEHFLSVPSGGNQTCGFEQAQMMGSLEGSPSCFKASETAPIASADGIASRIWSQDRLS